MIITKRINVGEKIFIKMLMRQQRMAKLQLLLFSRQTRRHSTTNFEVTSVTDHNYSGWYSRISKANIMWSVWKINCLSFGEVSIYCCWESARCTCNCTTGAIVSVAPYVHDNFTSDCHLVGGGAPRRHWKMHSTIYFIRIHEEVTFNHGNIVGAAKNQQTWSNSNNVNLFIDFGRHIYRLHCAHSNWAERHAVNIHISHILVLW